MSFAFSDLVDALRVAAEPTRLRVLALLSHGELSVGELAQILGQSQPRLSRHMKFLTVAGLVERLPEGAWVFYRLPLGGERRELVDALLAFPNGDDATLRRDEDRLAAARAERAATADAYFRSVAQDWERIRALHYDERAVENAILDAAGPGPFDMAIDVGTGTGRIVSLIAPRAKQAQGFDLSHDMLTLARANLERASAANISLRHASAYALPMAEASADLVVLHQVLHFLDEPERAIAEAGRILTPAGRVIVVDFALHDLEFLRTDHAHRRLGLRDEEVQSWMADAGLKTVSRETLKGDVLDVCLWVGAPDTGTNKPQSDGMAA
jgi:ubiquinone/menaquinone biosynthesis C-methylase UbiE